ncbi:MAG: tRNA 2-thiouridine(34) synthase MnmA [Eubacteriaceae bacterium]
MKNKNEVIIGISGGADSAASVGYLKEKGYRIMGVTFNFIDNPAILESAKKVADRFGIEHQILEARELFEAQVIEPFVTGYQQGKTPNPCLLCNQHLKFKLLIEMGNKRGIEKIGTGHYAKIELKNGTYELHESDNQLKDQSYFLYHLPYEVLNRVIFPVNNFISKDLVKKSIRLNLPDIADGKESQGICFIQNKSHSLYLKEKIVGLGPAKQGNIVDVNGKILGKHKGYFGFTIGQTRNLGIENKNNDGVLRIDPLKNEIVIGNKTKLKTKQISFTNPAFLVPESHIFNKDFSFKTGRWGRLNYGTITKVDNTEYLVASEREIEGVAPGQGIVFYDGSRVLGGGLIK